MSKTIGFSAQMDDILGDLLEDLDEVIEESIDKASKVCREDLKHNSPEKTGEYKTGWKVKKGKKASVVYNGKSPGLTHLLENGHVTRNKYGEYGRTPAKPHMKQAAEKGIDTYVEEVEKELDKKM